MLLQLGSRLLGVIKKLKRVKGEGFRDPVKVFGRGELFADFNVAD